MSGQLPGGLKVKRRAKGIYDTLVVAGNNDRKLHAVMDWYLPTPSR